MISQAKAQSCYSTTPPLRLPVCHIHEPPRVRFHTELSQSQRLALAAGVAVVVHLVRAHPRARLARALVIHVLRRDARHPLDARRQDPVDGHTFEVLRLERAVFRRRAGRERLCVEDGNAVRGRDCTAGLVLARCQCGMRGRPARGLTPFVIMG